MSGGDEAGGSSEFSVSTEVPIINLGPTLWMQQEDDVGLDTTAHSSTSSITRALGDLILGDATKRFPRASFRLGKSRRKFSKHPSNNTPPSSANNSGSDNDNGPEGAITRLSMSKGYSSLSDDDSNARSDKERKPKKQRASVSTKVQQHKQKSAEGQKELPVMHNKRAFQDDIKFPSSSMNAWEEEPFVEPSFPKLSMGAQGGEEDRKPESSNSRKPKRRSSLPELRNSKKQDKDDVYDWTAYEKVKQTNQAKVKLDERRSSFTSTDLYDWKRETSNSKKPKRRPSLPSSQELGNSKKKDDDIYDWTVYEKAKHTHEGRSIPPDILYDWKRESSHSKRQRRRSSLPSKQEDVIYDWKRETQKEEQEQILKEAFSSSMPAIPTQDAFDRKKESLSQSMPDGLLRSQSSFLIGDSPKPRDIASVLERREQRRQKRHEKGVEDTPTRPDRRATRNRIQSRSPSRGDAMSRSWHSGDDEDDDPFYDWSRKKETLSLSLREFKQARRKSSYDRKQRHHSVSFYDWQRIAPSPKSPLTPTKSPPTPTTSTKRNHKSSPKRDEDNEISNPSRIQSIREKMRNIEDRSKRLRGGSQRNDRRVKEQDPSLSKNNRNNQKTSGDSQRNNDRRVKEQDPSLSKDTRNNKKTSQRNQRPSSKDPKSAKRDDSHKLPDLKPMKSTSDPSQTGQTSRRRHNNKTDKPKSSKEESKTRNDSRRKDNEGKDASRTRPAVALASASAFTASAAAKASSAAAIAVSLISGDDPFNSKDLAQIDAILEAAEALAAAAATAQELIANFTPGENTESTMDVDSFDGSNGSLDVLLADIE